MKTMLDIMKERMPEGLEVVKAKCRTGASHTEILFSYKGSKPFKGWLYNTCAPGMVERNCDFTIVSAMIHYGCNVADWELVKEWNKKYEAFKEVSP